MRDDQAIAISLVDKLIKRGLNKRQIGILLAVERSTVTMWEAGKKGISGVVLIRLFAAVLAGKMTLPETLEILVGETAARRILADYMRSVERAKDEALIDKRKAKNVDR
jgi:hypothetical protein